MGDVSIYVVSQAAREADRFTNTNSPSLFSSIADLSAQPFEMNLGSNLYYALSYNVLRLVKTERSSLLYLKHYWVSILNLRPTPVG